MLAPTASQMLRDDERLRMLHRQTKKRRNRFLAKQKKLENEEENRRIMALHKRRELRNIHLPAYRKSRRSAKQAQCATSQQQQQQPVRVAPAPNIAMPAVQDRHGHANIDMHAPDILQPRSTRARTLHYQAQMQKISAAEKKTEFETTAMHRNHTRATTLEQDLHSEKEEYDEFDNALSDHLSVAELDNFERKHFGGLVEQSVQCRGRGQPKYSDEHADYSTFNACNVSTKKRNGYQQLFAKTTHYRQQQQQYQNQYQHELMQAMQSPPPPPVSPSHHLVDAVPAMTNVQTTHFVRTQLTASMNGSLFNINDADMKTPEDNDSVKIDPKDSIDCSGGGKVSLSTMYNSNLLPLHSALDGGDGGGGGGHVPTTQNRNRTRTRPKKKNAYFHQYTSYASNRENKRYRSAALRTSQVSNANTIQSEKLHYNNNNNKSYGIKLPRLTQSILKEKDRIDAKQILLSPKSIVSAPVWNNVAMQRKRNATTIIDDFFTKTSDDFLDANRGGHQNAQSGGGLPQIHRRNNHRNNHNRNVRKPSTKLPAKPNGAYSVISEYDILRQENNLEKSLMKLNAKLANLANNENKYNHQQPHSNRCKRNPNYMVETKVSIPKKLQVKKSPTFKRNRQRRRWNI